MAAGAGAMVLAVGSHVKDLAEGNQNALQGHTASPTAPCACPVSLGSTRRWSCRRRVSSAQVGLSARMPSRPLLIVQRAPSPGTTSRTLAGRTGQMQSRHAKSVGEAATQRQGLLDASHARPGKRLVTPKQASAIAASLASMPTGPVSQRAGTARRVCIAPARRRVPGSVPRGL